MELQSATARPFVRVSTQRPLLRERGKQIHRTSCDPGPAIVYLTVSIYGPPLLHHSLVASIIKDRPINR